MKGDSKIRPILTVKETLGLIALIDLFREAEKNKKSPLFKALDESSLTPNNWMRAAYAKPKLKKALFQATMRKALKIP